MEVSVNVGGLRSTPKETAESFVLFPAASVACTTIEWFPSAKPESVAFQVPEVFAPPDVSVHVAVVHVVPPSNSYCTLATPEAEDALGSVPVPEIVYAAELTHAGMALSVTVGGVVSILIVRLTVATFPATSVAVST
jgi:hypothetical protein